MSSFEKEYAKSIYTNPKRENKTDQKQLTIINKRKTTIILKFG